MSLCNIFCRIFEKSQSGKEKKIVENLNGGDAAKYNENNLLPIQKKVS
jgi:hypothetical protein